MYIQDYRLLARDFNFLADKCISSSTRKMTKNFKEKMHDSYDDEFTELFFNELSDITKVLLEWENKPIVSLGGKTPKEVFSSVNTLESIINAVTAFEEECDKGIPSILANQIKAMEEVIVEALPNLINNISDEKITAFDARQKAILTIALTIASESLIAPLMNLLSRFDDNSDDISIKKVIDIFIKVGTPQVLEILRDFIENFDAGSKLYSHILLGIGTIGANNKSEKVYAFLKECFRKSETKIVEATALKLYGDGRAIPAIRGYVERNIDKITEDDYEFFRDAVVGLGGNMEDLDYLLETE